VSKRFPEQVEQKFADFINYRIPGSETIKEVEERIYPEFDRIIAQHCGETIVIVAHGGVNLLFIAKILGLLSSDIFNLSQNFGCINKILIGDDFNKIEMLNSSGLH
ncbi:MAG: histidine phosphatase family protein, partial [Deltaproteobacteria bacterium]|nr:histidine phosphatase family protein [Deltaproteobacteria bacterium]